MKNVKHIKAPARLKVGKSYGDYKLYLILECLGQRLKKTKNPHYDYFYLAECRVCHTRQELAQATLSKNKSRFCRKCSKEEQKEGLARGKAMDYEKERNNQGKTTKGRTKVRKLAESGAWK